MGIMSRDDSLHSVKEAESSLSRRHRGPHRLSPAQSTMNGLQDLWQLRWPESTWVTNCFGMVEWCAVHGAASRLLPKHAAVAWWKHRTLSHVEQDGLPPRPKDRDAEQGNVDGPFECSLALGMVANIAAHQAARTLPCKPSTSAKCNAFMIFN